MASIETVGTRVGDDTLECLFLVGGEVYIEGNFEKFTSETQSLWLAQNAGREAPANGEVTRVYITDVVILIKWVTMARAKGSSGVRDNTLQKAIAAIKRNSVGVEV